MAARTAVAWGGRASTRPGRAGRRRGRRPPPLPPSSSSRRRLPTRTSGGRDDGRRSPKAAEVAASRISCRWHCCAGVPRRPRRVPASILRREEKHGRRRGGGGMARRRGGGGTRDTGRRVSRPSRPLLSRGRCRGRSDVVGMTTTLWPWCTSAPYYLLFSLCAFAPFSLYARQDTYLCEIPSRPSVVLER